MVVLDVILKIARKNCFCADDSTGLAAAAIRRRGIWTTPRLVAVVRSNLVALIKIDGLGWALLRYQTEFLAPVASATAAAAKNEEDGDESDEDSIDETRP